MKAVTIANRPPAPTPRPESTQVKEDKTPYIAKGKHFLLCCILCYLFSPKWSRFWSKNNTKLCTVCEGEFGRSCGREEVPGMHIAIVSGLQLNGAERLFLDAVCFIPTNHKKTVAPCCKSNKSEEGERPTRLHREPQSLTVQFQQREYFMKIKHTKVTGIIKAYKSLKTASPLFHLTSPNMHKFIQLIVIPTDKIPLGPRQLSLVHSKHTKMILTVQQAPSNPLCSFLLRFLVSSMPTLGPKGLAMQKRNWVHRRTPCINHPLCNREGTTRAAICNQSCPDQGQVSQNKSLHMFSIVLVPRAHERKERDFEVSIYWDSGASNHTRITFCSSLPLLQWKMWEGRWGLVED